jgi:hypothetical protein
MKRKTRRILFYSSIFIFVILSAFVVFYALGYQYDFVQSRFFKIGSFDVKTNISAEVYVNDVLAGKTSFLGNYFSQSRLLPRAYSIRVQADNYQPWQKLIKVDAGFLTSFPKVILLPKNFQEEVVASSSVKNIIVTKFDPDNGVALIGNNQKVESINLQNGEIKPAKLPLILPKNNTAEQKDFIQKDGVGLTAPDGIKKVGFFNNEIRVYWLKDSTNQPFKKAGDLVLVTRFSQPVVDVQWYKDSEHLLVSVGGILKLIEIDDRDGINVFDITTVYGPFYYDKNNDIVYKFEGNKLIKINLSGK